MNLRKICKASFIYFVSLSVFTTQMYAATNEFKLYKVGADGLATVVQSGHDINYSSLMNNSIDNLFADTDTEKMIIEVIDYKKNQNIEEAKKSDLKLKNASVESSLGVSGEQSNFSLKSEDSDGLYVGFLETEYNAVSRGYFVKRYSEYAKENSKPNQMYSTINDTNSNDKYILKDYIEFGRVNFAKDLALNLHAYATAKGRKTITPLLIAYYKYISGRNALMNKIPDTVATENIEAYMAGLDKVSSALNVSSVENNSMFNYLNADGSFKTETAAEITTTPVVEQGSKIQTNLPIDSWYGYLDLNLKTDTTTIQQIHSKLFALSLPISNADYGPEGKNKYTKATVTGDGSNNLFLKNGYVFNFESVSDNFNLMTHLSIAESFMANNNIKRGYFYESTQSSGKFSSHKKCSGKIRKKCYYWQELKTTSKPIDVYNISFVDESYMDNWQGADHQNTNAKESAMLVPTMIPVNTYANIPTLNEDKYGMFYATSYSGTIGGGDMNFDLFATPGITGGDKYKSNVKKVSSWGILAIIILVVIVVVIIVFTMGAATAALGALWTGVTTAGVGVSATAISMSAAYVGAIYGATFAGVSALTMVAVAAVTYAAVSVATMWAINNGADIWKDTFHPQKIINAIKNPTDVTIANFKELNKTLTPVPTNDKVFEQLRDSNIYKGIVNTTLSHSEDKSYVSGVFNNIAKNNAIEKLQSLVDNDGDNKIFKIRLPELYTMVSTPDYWNAVVIEPYLAPRRNLLLNENQNSMYNIKEYYRATVKNYLGL